MIKQRVMTLWLSKNKPGLNLPGRFRSEPYLLINLIFAGVILLIFVYSGFFSPDKDNYPVVCIHEKLTGEPCASCGLSHSFSLILRGRISEAYNWNIYGLRVFIFFAAQLLMRIMFSIFYLRYPDTSKQLIIYDIASSIIIFLICFLPFIRWIFNFL
jgi:hypothetical protein